ncbi:hypothetical protein ACQP2P_14855 [Dactylosporangium sp. CA-139114]|uniref:nSTAND1 domain-containing NTPase n=1 Tax=Dactylosporangium sp. CA-139114 TaxID=3239931 RepID=UPI003D966F44
MQVLVERFVEQQRVELSHDALLLAWPPLRPWIDDDRAGVVVEALPGPLLAAGGLMGGVSSRTGGSRS